MKLHGHKVILRCGTNQAFPILAERSATLEVKVGTKRSASVPRGTKGNASLRSWSINGQFFFSKNAFATMFYAIKNGTSLLWYVYTDYLGNGDETLDFSGRGIVTSLSFAGQGNTLVKLNITVKGTGKPQLSHTLATTLRYDQDNYDGTKNYI